MNQKNGLDALKPWLKPALTIFLGLVLLLHPDSLTSLIGMAVGFVVALVGCGLLVSFFFGNTKELFKETIRLNTSASGVESFASTQKNP